MDQETEGGIGRDRVGGPGPGKKFGADQGGTS